MDLFLLFLKNCVKYLLFLMKNNLKVIVLIIFDNYRSVYRTHTKDERIHLGRRMGPWGRQKRGWERRTAWRNARGN